MAIDDKVLLRELADAYGLAADRRDDDAFVALFTPDATLTIHQEGSPPAVFEGPEGLRAATAPLDGYVATMHLVANHVAEVSGDVAGAVTYCHAGHVRESAGGHENLHMVIRYDDRCVRGPDGAWRFSSRDLSILWTEVRPVSLVPLRFE